MGGHEGVVGENAALGNTAASLGNLEPSRPAVTIDRQGFLIGDLQLLVSFETASELAEMQKIYRIPGVSRAILGVANLHGNVMPVFDLHARFGQVRSATSRQMLLVFGRGEKGAAIVIDGLPRRKRFLPEEAVPLDTIPPVVGEYAAAAWAQTDGVWADFSHEALFDELVREGRM
jgi:twitching motility protein PilI